MKVQTETRNHRAGDVLFHGGDVLVADARHVVPKALTGELPGRQWQQAPQRRLLVPIGNVGLAGDPLAFAQVVVGFAANDLFGEAWHSVRSYYTQPLVCQWQTIRKYWCNDCTFGTTPILVGSDYF